MNDFDERLPRRQAFADFVADGAVTNLFDKRFDNR